jgi:hypothetical protein
MELFRMTRISVTPSRALAPLALASLVLLTGCSGAGDKLTRAFGLSRDAPDEFQVTTRAPLSMPPDFTLRPPEPGAPRPQERSTARDAEAALAPQTALAGATAGPDTPGQDALVQAAGPAAPADIRRRVDADASLDEPGRSFTDRLMFWRTPPLPGVTVDPTKEAQRLRENAALGQNENQGDTPIIQPRSTGSSLFGNLF